MARLRKLTIAGMVGTFKLRFRDIANSDTAFSAISGGKITVDRSQNGTTYIVTSDTPHFRVFADILGPDDLPNVFHWDDSTAYGWWILEGYGLTEFTPGGFSFAAEDSANEFAARTQEELGKPKQIKPS